MPELPEVETIRSQILEYLPLKIKKEEYSVHAGSILKNLSTSQLKKKLMNDLTLHHISRVGKMLCFEFSKQNYLISHLGMSGSWMIARSKIKLPHTHLQFETSDSKQKKIYLAYVDPRRFGKAYLCNEEEKNERIKKLGPDIYSSEFTQDYLTKTLKRFPERKIKVSLLDQSLYAGIGNYLASEICAHARIRPTRRCKNIKKKEIPLLYQAFFKALDPSIKTGGTTFSGGYRDAHGEAGEGLSHLVVFHQKICKLCNSTPVKKIILAQRGTFYCPKCQS